MFFDLYVLWLWLTYSRLFYKYVFPEESTASPNVQNDGKKNFSIFEQASAHYYLYNDCERTYVFYKTDEYLKIISLYEYCSFLVLHKTFESDCKLNRSISTRKVSSEYMLLPMLNQLLRNMINEKSMYFVGKQVPP